MSNPICCQHLDGAADSPFDVIALGYYDGPLDGFLACRVCGRTYHFEMLEWDHGRDIRIYALAEVRSEQYRRFLQVMDAPSANKDTSLLIAVRDALIPVATRKLIIAAANLSTHILGATRLPYAGWSKLLNLKPFAS